MVSKKLLIALTVNVYFALVLSWLSAPVYVCMFFKAAGIGLAVANVALALKDLIIYVVGLFTHAPAQEAKVVPLKTLMWVKLTLAPFVSLTVLIWLSAPLMTLYPMTIMVTGWFFVPAVLVSWVAVFFIYIIQLATSGYEIHRIIILGKSGALSKKRCVKHIILQLIFIADVADAVYLYKKHGKAPQ